MEERIFTALWTDGRWHRSVLAIMAPSKDVATHYLVQYIGADEQTMEDLLRYGHIQLDELSFHARRVVMIDTVRIEEKQ